MFQSSRQLPVMTILAAALLLAFHNLLYPNPLLAWLPVTLLALGLILESRSWLERLPELAGLAQSARERKANPAAVSGATKPHVMTFADEHPEGEQPLDQPEAPLDAIVEPRPMAEIVESDSLPPETAILEHAQTAQPPESDETRPAIAVVDVEPQPIADIEAAAEQVAADIRQNADEIEAMLKAEASIRRATAPESPRVTELSRTLPEMAGDAARLATGALAAALKMARRRLREQFSDRLPWRPGDPEAARAIRAVEERVVDTQERSDSAASWVGEDDAAQSPGDPGENINLSDDPNPFVEGFPKSGQSEFSGMAESAALEHQKQSDDLTVIEGIGHKMAAALKAAGIDTYARLARSSEAELRAAIEAAGLRLAPTLRTWAEQAAYAERGDWDGLAEIRESLSARRKRTRAN